MQTIHHRLNLHHVNSWCVKKSAIKLAIMSIYCANSIGYGEIYSEINFNNKMKMITTTKIYYFFLNTQRFLKS